MSSKVKSIKKPVFRRRTITRSKLSNRVYCPKKPIGDHNTEIGECKSCTFLIKITEYGVWCNFNSRSDR